MKACPLSFMSTPLGVVYVELSVPSPLVKKLTFPQYFASMIRERYDLPDTESPAPSDDVKIVPSVTLRPHTVDQFKALKDSDSITIDPHKSGYIPYPAGGLCYKDGRMRFLLTWAAPYIQQSKTGDSIGIYGVEGR
jgi:hypothetical protein